MWRKLEDDIRAQHARFDGEIREWADGYASRGGRTFCGRGCSECCSLTVNAIFTEALVIAGQLAVDRAARVREHALRLLDNCCGLPDLLSYLRVYRATMGSCPLLNADGACSIYDFRPVSCRSLHSTRESRYCGLDFGALSQADKMAFIAGLDLSEVSFPMHYAAFPRDRGQDLESAAGRSMAAAVGFSLYGNLPFLIWLELEYRLSRVAIEGYEAVARFLKREGLDNPFLVTLDQYDTSNCRP